MAISAGDAVVELGLDTSKLDRDLKGVSGRLRKASEQWGRKMKIAGAAMVGSVALVGGASLKMAADFDSAMRSVNTMLLLNEEEFKNLSADVKGLARDMGVDATESAKALYQAISAGVPKENVIDFLKIATEAAIGGITDTETAVDGLTTVINAFKLPMSDAQKIADVMFTTVKGGKTTFEELSASLFQVAPIAAASGVSFEEVSAALATMTKQGVPTKIATTQLRQAMVALQKPTKEMNDVISDLGYASGQTMVEEIGLAETLRKLREATGGSNEMLMKMFGSVEAGQAVLALTGDNAEMFAADLEAMGNAAGAATDAFNQMEQSTARQMEKLQAQFKDMAISIGNALMPALQSLMKIVTPIIEKIGKWLEENPKLVATILAIVAGVGSLLLVGGFLLPMISSIIAIAPVLGAAFTVMLGPVGLIIAAIVALIAIGVLLYKNWDTIKTNLIQAWAKIKLEFFKVWENITEFFDNIIESVAGLWGRVVEVFANAWESAKEWGKNIVLGLWEGIQSLAGWIWDKMTAWAANLWSSVTSFFGFGSPSKLAIEAGKNIAAGLVEGMSIRPIVNLQSVGATMAGAGATLSGGTTVNNFQIAQMVVRDESDIRSIARELERLRLSRARGQGVT